MQFTLFIFGVFIVTTFMDVLTCGMEVRFFTLGGRINVTSTAVRAQTDKTILSWILNTSGHRSNTTTTSHPNKSGACPPCECGLSNSEHRIVGGVDTEKNEYPWMAHILLSGRPFCGASVINPQYVLTAAHCTSGTNKERMVIRVGNHDRTFIVESQIQDFKPEKIITHHGFSWKNLDNDIALIKLKGVIKFGGPIRPVCLPEPELTYAGKKGIVTGWGHTGEFQPGSTVLRQVTVPIMTNAQCRSTNYTANQITDNMMCAGYQQGGKDACQGDSGGPLHVVSQTNEGQRLQLVGIVSWGEGCAVPNHPGVYTRVNRYLTWIKTNMPNACLCH